MIPRDTTGWVLTDGKAGDEQQALGVAEALGLAPALRRVAPRSLFAALMPWGPVDPKDCSHRAGSPIAPPYPDLCLASGRRAVPYLRAVKRASGGRTFTVFLKDPRTGLSTADLIWAPEHDGLSGPNVLTTLTPPHRIAPARLANARANPDPRLSALKPPRVAVLAGGDSRHHRFTDADVARFLDALERLAATGPALMITASRRTPPALRAGLERLAAATAGFFWDGTGENPYVPLLALADAIVVTADSFNMVGEAAATGTPILVFTPSGGHPKLDAFMAGLARHGAVRSFEGRLEAFAYEPLDATPVIAAAIAAALDCHRQGLARP